MLEVCVESLDAMRIAVSAGSQRIELCEQLDEGGVTASSVMLHSALKLANTTESDGEYSHGPMPVIALIRCRSGDFVYDALEQRFMLDQSKMAIDVGCKGIAVGACTSAYELDWGFLEAVARLHSDSELVVHRVFDGVPDPIRAVPRLIEMGYRRILTSGGGERAIDSLERLRELQQCFADQIEILPGGGVSSANADRILSATGCKQLHGSFRKYKVGRVARLPDADEIGRVRTRLNVQQVNP